MFVLVLHARYEAVLISDSPLNFAGSLASVRSLRNIQVLISHLAPESICAYLGLFTTTLDNKLNTDIYESLEIANASYAK